MSTDDKTPLDRALDLFVFAPLGMALTAREALPDLIEKGRQQVTSQATVARMMGEFAVKQGREDAEKAVSQLRDQAGAVLSELGLTGGGAQPAPATPPPRAPAASAATGASPTNSSRAATPSTNSRPTSGPGAADLAIPDYDSLSASQVVPRLAGLSADELEAVRGYEAAHRGRKTILNRVAQLQTS